MCSYKVANICVVAMLKRLSNQGETRVFGQISPVADRYGASVYRKVRIADVIDIDKLNDQSLGTYALKAHFDFAIANEKELPLFVVEFDGPGHSTRKDNEKNEICRQAGLTLFRAGLHSTRTETSQLSFVGYLTHIWFLATKFGEMQASGELLADEPFMISGFLRPGANNVFDSEFDLLGPARSKFVRYCKVNEIPGGPLWQFKIAELLISHDEDGFASFCSFPVGSTRLYGRSVIDLKLPSLGSLDLPFIRHEIGQFCTALAIGDLLEECKLYQEAGHIVRRRDRVVAELTSMKARGYRPLLRGGDDEDFKSVW